MVLVCASLGACERAREVDSREDPARQILDGAQRALGVEESAPTLQLLADASVEGPGGGFRTRVHSSSDGRVRMEQTPQGFLGGVGRSGAWRADGGAGPIDSLGPALAFVRGHELHMMALAPRSRLHSPRFLGTTYHDGSAVLAVAMSMPGSDSLVAYFDPSDTLPVGFRVTWTDPHVEVTWSGWSERGGIRVFERAAFRQGAEEFRYAYDTIRVGAIPDSVFEPPLGPGGDDGGVP